MDETGAADLRPPARADDEVPTVADSLERYDRLGREGNSLTAFSLSEPYDELGARVPLTRR